jgi:asparagine synthase (glutamine-hydrolysing)
MSAIAGLVQFDGASVEPGLVEKMTNAMVRRGPDGVGHWVGGPSAFGQCMLRTTAESLEETQPLADEDGHLVLVMDGRVDNCDELRRALLTRGAALRNRSDAELVLRAYQTWGEFCPDRIVGEFAFVIWDARQRRLFGARDAAGTRHFYYHAARGWFGFASEITGLLALGRIEARLNESRLLDYLAVDFDRDDEIGTFYQGISRLPAGHAMLVTDRGPRIWRYWEPGNLAANHFASLDECAEAFLEQLRVAVKCRLRSIGPVGAMLSGGLDSSSIVGLIRKEFRDQLRQPLKTFSLVREDRENCADWMGVQEMLKEGWIDPAIIDSSIARTSCEAYLDGIKDINEPFSYSEGIFDSFVFEAARKAGCRVVLDGMAGDLLFYDPDRSMDSIIGARMYSQIPGMLTALRRHGIGSGLRFIARRMFGEAASERLHTAYRNLRDRRAIWSAGPDEPAGGNLRRVHPEIARRFLAERHARRREAEGRSQPENDQGAHARHFTSGLLSFAHEVIGQMALSRGVEPRSPLSDRRMIEFAIQMPVEAKLFAGWYKPVMRKSMRGVLPEKVRLRRSIGRHPGWKFHERLISEFARTAPDVWNSPCRTSILKRWIDPSRLAQARRYYDCSADYGTGFDLFALAILAQWLSARNLNSSRN